MRLSPIKFENETLYVLDQRQIPHKEVFLEVKNINETFEVIENMAVRGAPCIGFTALYGLALWLKDNEYNKKDFLSVCSYIKSARPTAVNLAFEVDSLVNYLNINSSNNAFELALSFANNQVKSLHDKNLEMAKIAEVQLDKLIAKKKYNILTHCNTGFLACGTIGTALGVIEYLGSKNKVENVWVDETRPYLQGSRLTAFELQKLNIPHKIVVDSASSHLMSMDKVDAIFVGADRIVRNGDTANKIGTSNLAIIASVFQIPFYIVAPKSSFDITLDSGKDIEIELRPSEEISEYSGIKISPKGSEVYNPSFDITDHKFITGIICEDGLLSPPYLESIPRSFNEK